MGKRIIHLYAPILTFVALVALGMALWTEQVAGLRPCLLCLYHRYGWMILGVLGLMTWGPLKRWGRKIPLILGFYCLGLTGLATYQVLIQERYMEAPAACKSNAIKANTAEELWEAMEEQPLAACDEKPFKWAGLSMAAYGGLLTTALAILCFFAWFYYPQPRTRP